MMNRRHLIFSLATVALAGASACGGGNDSPTGPSTGSAPFSVTDLRAGTGATAASGQRLTVNYQGWLYSDTAADNKGSRFDAGTFAFVLGTRQVIAGWDQGLVGMRVGGLRRLVIPPELGYGASGNGPIPPNATLLFEVELLSIP